MRKNLYLGVFLSVLFLFESSSFLLAQTEYRLYGTATYSGGSIFSLNSTGADLITHKVFSANGNGPAGTLLESEGYLYGMTSGGGAFNAGIVFSLQSDGTGFDILHEFNSIDGSQPQNGLILGDDGKLYGLTSRGGSFNNGIAFRINKDGSGFEKLHDFLSSTGKTPVGILMQASDGNFYGTTSEGGSHQKGIIFKMDGTNFNYTVLHHFNGNATPVDPDTQNPDGAEPHGGVIEGEDGKLYGLTYAGGTHGVGSIFSIEKTGFDYTTLRSFQGSNGFDGASPLGDLVQVETGELFGMTSKGGQDDLGVVFTITPGGDVYSLVADLDGTAGISPKGSLILNDDFLYGITTGADSYDATILKISSDGTTVSYLYSFSDGSRYDVTGSLVMDSDGDLYGIKAPSGDLHENVGSIYKLDIQTLQSSTIHSFVLTHGSIPTSKMVQGPDLRLYGTTVGGGTYGMGAIYSITSTGEDFRVVYSFKESEGKFAYGGLIPIGGGFFAGTTAFGGAFLNGVVYKIKYDGTGFTRLHDFKVTEGSGPLGKLALGTDNKLYGLANGGPTENGLVFRVGTDGSNFETVYNFEDVDGSVPRGGLIKASNGSFYGVTSAGGANNLGVIFRIDPDKTYTKLVDFNGTNGSIPYGDLIQASDGSLYGMTSASTNGAGVIYRIKPDGSEFTVVHALTQNEGGHPLGELTQAPTGEFYAMGTAEGQFGTGYIFRLDSDGSNFQKLADLDFINGNPQSGLSVVPLLTQTITFDEIGPKTFGDGDFTLSASASSSLPVVFYSSDPTIAKVTGNTVSILGGGTVTITAYQKGNVYYSTAKATQEVTINKSAQSITFDDIFSKTLGDAPFTPHATATSGLTVSFSPNSDKITVNANSVSMIKAGRAFLKADQAGNANYLAAPSVETSFCINPARPVISQSASGGSLLLSSSNNAGNQWYLNGEKILDATSVDFMPTVNGDYTVQSTADDCASQVSAPINVTFTGLEDQALGRVVVYPNPADDEVYIEVPGEPGSQAIVTLLDGTGRAIESRTVYINKAERFDASRLSHGIFFFHVRTDRGTTTRSFIRK